MRSKIIENSDLNVDRNTEIGKMINAYLTNAVETDDKAIHLLFAANRWEKM